jgi:hypothetical protein
VKLSRPLGLSVAAALAGGLLPLLVAVPAEAAPTPIVVTGGDLSADGSSGWAVESRNGGTGAFVAGTATPPLGIGSYYLKSNAIGDKQFLHLTKVDGVALAGRPLTDLLSLSFSSFAANGVYSPYVNIPMHSGLVDANSDGIADGLQSVPAASGNAILVFEPTVSGGAWNASDTMAPGALWRVTRPVVTSGGTIPTFTYKTYAQWLAILTDGAFNPAFGDVQWVIGDTSSASWSGKSGWVDDIEVTTTTESATYDLEEGLGTCPVAIDAPTKTLTLTGDCTTSTTLTLHDGWSLDGAGHTITAVDPTPASFTGPVLTNEIVPGGAAMHVTNVTIDGNLAAGCSSSLFGIRFDGASGSFTNSSVSDIRYGSGSGCQSGNSVDITNLGGPTRLPVTLSGIGVTGFQKTGIRANGNVALRLSGSSIASSDLDLVTASNSLQISRGARAYVSGNTIGGNDWDGNDQWSATGVLLYGAEDVTFIRNVVSGTDTDIGLYVSQDATYQAGRTTLTCNAFERDGATDSTPPGALDVWNTGVAADPDLVAMVSASGNTVRGFATAYDNVVNESGGPCASGPVDSLQVDGGASSVTATWYAPVAQPFAPVTSYSVTLAPGGTTQVVAGTTATFTGLLPAKQYTVTVVPLNAAGPGAPASASGTTGPGAATITETSATPTTAAVDWSVPGGAYTSFDLVLEDAGGVVATQSTSGDARTWTFTGLDPETSYTVTVTPRIGVASGAPDSRSLTTGSVASAPGPVSNLSLTGSAATLTTTWSAASGATDYEATLLPGGQVQSVTGTSAAFSIIPGKEYTVTVVAHNAAGWGPGRSASLDTALPRAPRKLSVTGATKSASLTWTPPPAPASPVTSYTVTATPSSGSPKTAVVAAAGLAFPVTVSGLAPRTAYTFTVTATNTFGPGPAASKSLKGSTTTLRVSRSKIRYGEKVVLSGKVKDSGSGKPVSGQQIYLYRKAKGGTAYVNRGVKATTSSKGTFSIAFKPERSGRFFVTSRGPGRMGATSPSRSVTVKGVATLSPSRTVVVN